MDQVHTDVADSIAAILFDTSNAAFPHGSEAWLSSGSVTERMNVWVAVGVLIEHAGLSNADALAALRAYAFGHDTTLDDVSAQVMARQLKPGSLLPT